MIINYTLTIKMSYKMNKKMSSLTILFKEYQTILEEKYEKLPFSSHKMVTVKNPCIDT